MKAAVYDRPGPPEVLEVRTVADPQVRRNGLIVEVRAIGVQGGDLVNRRVTPPPRPDHVVGYQASGVVREVGPETTGFAVGDRVVTNAMHGSHAEAVSTSARKTWRLPDAISYEDASAVPIEFGTASDALFEFGSLNSGETVLVQGGAGGVGLAAVQLASAAGATVIATASRTDRLDRLAEFGVDHAIDYRAEDVAERALELTDGRGVDLVVDPIGGSTLESSIAALAYRGRISWIGNAGREPADVWRLMEKNGCLMPQFFAMEQSRQPERTHALVAELLARVAAGELQVAIDRTFSLADAATAHDHAERGHPFGRVIILPER